MLEKSNVPKDHNIKLLAISSIDKIVIFVDKQLALSERTNCLSIL